MSDQPQTDATSSAELLGPDSRQSPNGLRFSVADKRFIVLLICGAIGYSLVTSASNNLDRAVATERAAQAEEIRKENPWAKD